MSKNEKIKSSWLNTMDYLKLEHKKIAEIIGCKKVAYLDIPIHFNVGDLLIYKGTEQFFKDYEVDVIYRSCNKCINHKVLEESDVILFHGGGNFGDLYISHQKFREDIIKKYKHKKIICLPQTIKFSNANSQNESKVIFNEHPDIYILVRDLKSLEIARQFTKNIVLMPDMAHSLHPLIDVSELVYEAHYSKVLNLVRIDVEALIDENRISKRGFDWVNIITQNDCFIQSIYNRISFFTRHSNRLNERAISMWSNCISGVVFRSVDFFSNHTIIHTDRLHGLILGSLLGKEIKLFDNSYGKNTSYYNLWLKEYISIKKG